MMRYIVESELDIKAIDEVITSLGKGYKEWFSKVVNTAEINSKFSNMIHFTIRNFSSKLELPQNFEILKVCIKDEKEYKTIKVITKLENRQVDFIFESVTHKEIEILKI